MIQAIYKSVASRNEHKNSGIDYGIADSHNILDTPTTKMKKKMKKNDLVVERLFEAPVHLVWQALTQKDLMKEWYFEINEFKPEIGFEFQFKGQGLKGEEYLHLCKIIEVEPLKKLKHSWTYDGLVGYSTVTFELFDDGADKTRLRLTHEGLETFPMNNPDFARESFEKGWTYLIDTALKDFLSTT